PYTTLFRSPHRTAGPAPGAGPVGGAPAGRRPGGAGQPLLPCGKRPVQWPVGAAVLAGPLRPLAGGLLSPLSGGARGPLPGGLRTPPPGPGGGLPGEPRQGRLPG